MEEPEWDVEMPFRPGRNQGWHPSLAGRGMGPNPRDGG
jgi:hypothetical protein